MTVTRRKKKRVKRTNKPFEKRREDKTSRPPVLYLMLVDPGQYVLIFHCARRNAQSDFDNLVISAAQAYAVYFEKRQHCIHANAFVSIYKSMIGNQGISEPGSFFLLAGI